MPIVDRWLDQAPERLHALANVLVQKGRAKRQGTAALEGWVVAFTELEDVAKNYNPDGVPVAVEGLEVLASYVQISVEGDAALNGLVREMTRLAEDNRSFEHGARDRSTFDTWAKRTLVSITDLREMTAQRISTKFA